MNEVFFYSLSSVPLLYPRKLNQPPQMEWLTHSIKSLKKYVKNPTIYICYTPPDNSEDEETLRALGTLLKRDNIIRKKRGHEFVAHADRVVNRAYAYLIEDADVLFSVDTDIIFKDDPRKMLDDNHDVYGTLGESRYKFISIRFLAIKDPFYRLCNQRWVTRYMEDEREPYWSMEVCLLRAFRDYNCKIKHIPIPNKWFVHRPSKFGKSK